MSYTTRGFEVTRVTIASSSKTESNTLLDLVVKPIGLLLDANTRWSGLSPERIETGYDVRFEDLYEKLSSCLSSETIIIGHGLENDMKVLRIAHERIIDTSVLFPHPNGLPYRHSLRVLCSQHLQRLIQTGNGHDSVMYRRWLKCIQINF